MASGIQNKNEIKIDLVYTKLGRHYKMTNDSRQNIVKYAFADDGVNYNLFDDSKPEAERGKLIEETPQFDTWTDESYLLKNKLVTVDRDATFIPQINVSPESLDIRTRINYDRFMGKKTHTVNIDVGVKSPNGFKVTLQDIEYLYINNKPTSEQHTTTNGYVYEQKGSSGLPTKLYTIKSNGNTTSQTWNILGSDNIPTTSASFKVIYDPDYSEYTSVVPYNTNIIVESNDGYGSVTIPVQIVGQ